MAISQQVHPSSTTGSLRSNRRRFLGGLGIICSSGALGGNLWTAGNLLAQDSESHGEAIERLIADSPEIPGLAALTIKDGRVDETIVAGVRKLGSRRKITKDNRFHIGSCTKAMTATLAAVMVERRIVKWSSTIGDFVRDRWLHDGYRKVTLAQLLSHAGGCPAQPEAELWRELFVDDRKLAPVRQRQKLARGILSQPPVFTPGDGYVYSNSGYAIAGLMMESAAKEPWEKLMEEHLFEPLKMRSAGFGAPGSNKTEAEPWGHRARTPVPPQPHGDNPAAIGPGGTVHCSIEDWAKFALLHLSPAPNKLLRNAASLKTLHTTQNEKGSYGLGWIVGGESIAHDGTNTMWYASAMLRPEKKAGVLVCLNAGGETAIRLCHQVRDRLWKSLPT